jgi:hypothetical protein
LVFYNKTPWTGWYKNSRNLFLTVLEAGSPRSIKADSVSGEVCFLEIEPSCIFTCWKGWRISLLSGHSLVPSSELYNYDLITSQGPCLLSHHLEVRISRYEVWGDSNIQTTAYGEASGRNTNG